MAGSITLRIRRQDSPEGRPYWQEFILPYRENLNVNACLQELQRRPETAGGETVAPPVWEASCLEEVCGSCTMLVNGKARQACSTLVRNLVSPEGGTIRLEPLTKFATLRDLVVDRRRMFDALQTVRAWNPIDGTHDLGPAPARSQEEQAFAYALSRCMTCGCCMEACPQFGPGAPFLGPAPLGQAALFNMSPLGRLHRSSRLDLVMGSGGITDCGNAQNCVEVCPKEVPLTEALAVLHRDTTRRWFARLFGR